MDPDEAKTKSKKVNTWIHDCKYMENTSQLVIASDDHCISFCDFSTLLCNVRLNIGEIIPLTIDIWYDVENPDTNESMLIFGTDSGMIMIFYFQNDILFKNEATQKKGSTIFLDSFVKQNKNTCQLIKRKAHSDWVLKIRYYSTLRSIISCSPDPKESLVFATHNNKKKWTFISLPVHKGVNCFEYCKFPAVLVTGGTDRQLRIWNCHRLKNPMAALRGHSSPIIDIAINESSGQIISLSTDKVVKVWDIRKQNCVQTLMDPFTHRPEDSLSSINFSNVNGGSLVCASYTLTPYQLQQKQVSVKVPKSHEFPLRAAIYNKEFKQIVSGDDGGVVNVWNPLSGQKTFRLVEVHDKLEEITAMAFDNNNRRLITGGRAGTIRMWNFNNGAPLHVFKGDSSEVTGIVYFEMKETDWIVTTGWNRRITMYTYKESCFEIYPSKIWPEMNQSPWHSGDILSLSFCPPNLLATSSVDGEIIIVNLITGQIQFRLTAFDYDLNSNIKFTFSVDKVMYLYSRNNIIDASNLVSIGSDGKIRFWNTYKGILMGEFDGGHDNEGICSMCTDTSNNILVTGDVLGYISVWDISETCWEDTEVFTMPLISSFRGHVKSVLSVDLIESVDIIVTASADCTARIFTYKGEYVGTLGQSDLWDLTNPTTFQHPLKPLEVIMSELEACSDDQTFQKLKEMSTKTNQSKKKTKKIFKENIYEEVPDRNRILSRAATSKSLSSSKLLSRSEDNSSEEESDCEAANGKQVDNHCDWDLSRTSSNSISSSVEKLIEGSNAKKVTMKGEQIYFDESVVDHAVDGGIKADKYAKLKKPPKTAELMRKEYGTWYASSIYSKSGKYRPAYVGKPFTKKKINILSKSIGIYNSLKPVELSEILDIRK
ncbi:hypothetical protein HDU92_008924 [Lobulomyces angularis]|nr:hypothetical protein HDU92_008924 [Lobulomyces angularis]